MRGANFWNDHYLARGKLRMRLSWTVGVKKSPLPFAVHGFAMPEMCDAYAQPLEEKLSDWSLSEGTTEEY